MYQPYPTGTQLPEVQRPPIPTQVTNAVRTMYVGAAASLPGIVIDILTVKGTKSAIEKRSHHLTASQITSTQRGQSWARITGTVLFALATVDTLIGLSAPIAGAVKLWALVTWLAGLTAVIFLWRRPSTAFFKGATLKENNQ